MVDDEYKPDFPSEIIREGKVQVLVPKLKPTVLCLPIMRLLKLQSSTTPSWSSTVT